MPCVICGWEAAAQTVKVCGSGINRGELIALLLRCWFSLNKALNPIISRRSTHAQKMPQPIIYVHTGGRYAACSLFPFVTTWVCLYLPIHLMLLMLEYRLSHCYALLAPRAGLRRYQFGYVIHHEFSGRGHAPDSILSTTMSSLCPVPLSYSLSTMRNTSNTQINTKRGRSTGAENLIG